MKNTVSVIIVCAIFMFSSGCNQEAGTSSNSATTASSLGEVCKGVFAQEALEISKRITISDARELATNLAVAAQADVDRLKAIGNAGGSVETGASAQLGKQLQGVVTTKTVVTTEFFQQDQSFAQAACYLETILTKELSRDDREFFEEKRRSLMSNRTTYLDYLTGLKKN